MSDATAELALCTWITDNTGAVTTTEVGNDLQDLVAEDGAVVEVRRVPGGRDLGWQKILRFGVTVYAATYTDVWRVAADVEDALIGPDWVHPAGWVFDRVVVDSAFAKVDHENLRQVAAFIRVTTRS